MEATRILLICLVTITCFSIEVVLSVPAKSLEIPQILTSHGKEVKKGGGGKEATEHNAYTDKPLRLFQTSGGRLRRVITPPKDTYALLASLRKIQGHDGKSPLCKICATNYVDANTYDYFCLPDGDYVNGEMCDTLTILGTTTNQRINLGCKLIISRRPIICK